MPSFYASDGDRIGVIGLNGAGKTTFLKVLSGALVPNYGHCHVEGSVQPLINVAGGFDENLSCAENIKLVLALRGEGVSVSTDLEEQILSVSRIGFENRDLPLKLLSSGMKMNFAVALTKLYSCEILLLDEFISARDARFSNSGTSLSIESLIEQSKIMVLCSHSMRRIQEHCEKVIFLHNGQVKFFGGARETVKRYEQFVLKQISREENNIANRRKKKRKERKYLEAVKFAIRRKKKRRARKQSETDKFATKDQRRSPAK